MNRKERGERRGAKDAPVIAQTSAQIEEQQRAENRASLKAGAIARAAEDRELAEEWFPVEQEVWDRHIWADDDKPVLGDAGLDKLQICPTVATVACGNAAL